MLGITFQFAHWPHHPSQNQNWPLHPSKSNADPPTFILLRSTCVSTVWSNYNEVSCSVLKLKSPKFFPESLQHVPAFVLPCCAGYKDSAAAAGAHPSNALAREMDGGWGDMT